MTGSVIAYHGTSSDRLGSISTGGFLKSVRTASWLGYGVYFFYNAPGHAETWAREVTKRRGGASLQPTVIEAEIQLGNCLNLLDSQFWPQVTAAYRAVPASVTQKSFFGPPHPQAGLNYRDCAALNALVAAFNVSGNPIDTIAAALVEGSPIDPNSYLFDKSAVAICVQSPASISIRSVYVI